MKRCVSFLITALMVLTFTSCGGENTTTRQSFAFDTVVNITANKSFSSEISQAFELCKSYGDIFSRTSPDSELYAINTGEDTSPSADIKNVLDFSLDMSRLTDGAFDITVAPLVELWDANNRTAPPTDAEIKAAQEKVGYRKISGEPFSLQGACLDMGAVAKGYIADRLIGHFKKNNVADVIVDLGGNVALLGEHTVGIRNPFSSDEVFAVIKLKDKSAVTSGAYQRYFIHNQKRYHHIIDPRTGKCADSGIASVTVVSPSSMWADALSTSIFILGEDALSLCKEFPDTDALIINENGTVITTDGFEEKYDLEYN